MHKLAIQHLARNRIGGRFLHSSASQRAVLDKIFNRSPKSWGQKNPAGLPVEVAQASQNLRQVLTESSDQQQITQSLMALIQAYPSETTSSQLFRLVQRTLEKVQGKLSVEQSQDIFRKIVNSDTDGGLSAQLYMLVSNSSRISEQDQIMNAYLYFLALRNKGMNQESGKLIAAAIKAYPSVGSSPEFLFKLLQQIDAASDPETTVRILTAVPGGPSQDVIRKAVMSLVEMKDVDRQRLADQLEILATHLLFDNPHFTVNRDTLVLILDSLISLNVQKTGRRALRYALQQASDKEDLAYLELLLLSCIHFEDTVSTGDSLVQKIMTFPEKELVKESWDAIAQWSVYRSSERQLLEEALAKMSENGFNPDSTTMYMVLRTAGQFAKRSEEDILGIRDYFTQNLSISLDAAGYSVLIQRALGAVEVEKARCLFIDSIADGANWNTEDGKYLPVLYDLVVAVSKAPTFEKEIIMDTYQRVRLNSTDLPYAAQAEILKMLLAKGTEPEIAMFLIEQFGEVPALPSDKYKDIYHAFVNKIMECNDDQEAWGLYGILNTTIILPYESYYPIQLKFCSLGRPDAAHLMFRHLRNRAKKEGIKPPGREMYMMLFSEYSKWLYEEGVKELETYFRMDLNNDLDNLMFNRILDAYTNLQDVKRISDLWMEISSFPTGKGVTNETVTLMLKNYTRFALEAVDDLWTTFPEQFGISPNEDNLKQYVIANCYHGYYTRALEITQSAKQTYGIEPTKNVIEALYNWTLIDSRKAHVEKWAVENHPQLWQQLESEGRLKSIMLPENTQNDSEAHLRHATIEQLEAATTTVTKYKKHEDDD